MRWAPYAVRTAALGMLLATAGVLVAQAPAHACKCVNTTTAEDAAAADALRPFELEGGENPYTLTMSCSRR